VLLLICIVVRITCLSHYINKGCEVSWSPVHLTQARHNLSLLKQARTAAVSLTRACQVCSLQKIFHSADHAPWLIWACWEFLGFGYSPPTTPFSSKCVEALPGDLTCSSGENSAYSLVSSTTSSLVCGQPVALALWAQLIKPIPATPKVKRERASTRVIQRVDLQVVSQAQRKY